MQWFAYVIWAGVALCLAAAVVSYVVARRGSSSERAESGDEEIPETVTAIAIDAQRWGQVRSISGGDNVSWPQQQEAQFFWATELLGINGNWLQGADGAMYPCLSFHNDVTKAADFIAQRLEQGCDLQLFAVKPQGVELDESVYEASVVLCFCQQVAYAGQTLSRYFPVNVYWEWGYPPEQMQCRQILYLAKSAGCSLIGIETDLDGIYELLEGITIPEVLHQGGVDCPQWPATDFALPAQHVGGLTDCHLNEAQLLELINTKGWIAAVPGNR